MVSSVCLSFVVELRWDQSNEYNDLTRHESFVCLLHSIKMERRRRKRSSSDGLLLLGNSSLAFSTWVKWAWLRRKELLSTLLDAWNKARSLLSHFYSQTHVWREEDSLETSISQDRLDHGIECFFYGWEVGAEQEKVRFRSALVKESAFNDDHKPFFIAAYTAGWKSMKFQGPPKWKEYA